MSVKRVIEERIVRTDGTLYVRKYEVMEYLGRGGFAKCYVLRNVKTDSVAAVKVISKSLFTKPVIKKKVLSEIQTHRALKHPNIVEFGYFFEDCDNVYITLELCNNGTLSEAIKRTQGLTEEQTRKYLFQLVSAAKYLHHNGVVHRDLKLGNLLLNDQMDLKIADFGLAVKIQRAGERRKTVCGTPNYMAPEMLESGHGHSFGVDIWAIGVILYACLYGVSPFQSGELATIYRKIKTLDYCFPSRVEVSDSAKALIRQLLRKEESQRISLEGILDHEFLRTVSVVKECSGEQLGNYQNNDELLQKYKSVVKWVRSEQGVGYRMSDGGVGVLFSDMTTVFCLDSRFSYIPNMQKTDNQLNYSVEKYPNILANKVEILFKVKKETDGAQVTATQDCAVFVKSWAKVRHAIVFALTNHLTQVVFQDHTEILIIPQERKILYTDKQGKKSASEIEKLADLPSKGLLSRVEYIKTSLKALKLAESSVFIG